MDFRSLAEVSRTFHVLPEPHILAFSRVSFRSLQESSGAFGNRQHAMRAKHFVGVLGKPQAFGSTRL